MKTNQTQKNISSNWQQVKLGDCLERIEGGGTPSKDKPEYWIGSIPWASVKDVVTHNSNDTQDHISELGLKNSSSRIIKKGTLIVPTRMALGHAVVFNVDVAINQDLKALYPKKTLLNQYLFHWFKSKKDFIERLGSGSTVSGIQQNELKNIKFLLPPLPEQNRIVSVLETWDSTIEKLSKKIEVKKQIKKGLMQDLLTGRKRLKGFSDKWEIILLGNICKIRTGKKDVNQGNSEGVYPFFTCAKQHTYSDSYSFDTEAILVAGNGEVGNCQYYKGKFEAYQRTYVLNEFTKDVQYLFAYLNYFFQNTINSQKQMGAMPYIKLGMLQDYEIRIPKSREEQLAIAQILTTADKEIKRLENKLKILKEQKRYLLNSLITGTIRTPETLSAKLTK